MRIGATDVPNRIVRSATGEKMCGHDGAVPPLVVDFYRQSRKKLGNVPIVLGCMRPRDPGTETALLNEGLDGIAVPLPQTLKNGGDILRTCCSLIRSGNR